MSYVNSMYKSLKRVILKHPKDAFISQKHLDNNWKEFNYIDVPDFSKSIKEYEELESILRKYVDQIDYLPANDLVGLDSIYTHDPVKFTQHGAILLRSGKLSRQGETEAYREFLEKNDIPIIGELTDEAVADGGDIVWIDDRTVAVGLGFRTNESAIYQLKEILEPYIDEFIVVQLPYDQGPEECLHLMSFISIVDKDLAVVYSPLMPVFFRKLLLERGFELVEVTEKEYNTLGCNVLALSPRVCVLPKGNNIIKQDLEGHGAKVYEYEGTEISYKGTGGPTCLTCPVVRK